jgi:hypothetical protein
VSRLIFLGAGFPWFVSLFGDARQSRSARLDGRQLNRARLRHFRAKVEKFRTGRSEVWRIRVLEFALETTTFLFADRKRDPYCEKSRLLLVNRSFFETKRNVLKSTIWNPEGGEFQFGRLGT